MRLQKDYWEKWTEFSQQASGMAPPKSPWEQAMNHWWEAVSPTSKSPATEFMDKMMEQGKQFYHLAEGMKDNLGKDSDWSGALSGIFEKMREQMHDATHKASDSFSKAASFWQSPMENWQQFASKAMPVNMEATRSFDMFGQILGAPGLGYSREQEEQNKRLMQAWMEYQTALMDYNEELSDLGPLSIDRLQNKVRTMMEEGQSIDSARQLYDLWVAASEEVYGERAMTAEYSKVHGGLVNALMCFKRQWQDILDNRLGALGMPTQREMHTAQDRLQDTRRELRKLQSEMAALKKQVAGTGQTAPAQQELQIDTPKTAVTKKTTTKKKVAKKKVAKKAASKKAVGKKAAARKSAS